jgi:hypothetical protein
VQRPPRALGKPLIQDARAGGDAIDPFAMPDPPVLLILDLAGTFAFALNGALTAVRSAHLDIVGVISLGIITAVGSASASGFRIIAWICRTVAVDNPLSAFTSGSRRTGSASRSPTSSGVRVVDPRSGAGGYAESVESGTREAMTTAFSWGTRSTPLYMSPP